MLKKIGLIILIVAVIGVLGVGGLRVSHRRLTLATGRLQPLKTQVVSLAGSPQRLTIRLRTARLTVRQGATNTVALKNVVANQVRVRQTAQGVTVTQPQVDRFRGEIGATAQVQVTLTAATLRKLAVYQVNGTLTLRDLTTDWLQVTHLNGTTRASRLTVKQGGTLTGTNGQVALDQLAVDGLAVTVRTGKIMLDGHRTAHQKHYRRAGQHPLTIQQGTGQVHLTAVTAAP